MPSVATHHRVAPSEKPMIVMAMPEEQANDSNNNNNNSNKKKNNNKSKKGGKEREKDPYGTFTRRETKGEVVKAKIQQFLRIDQLKRWIIDFLQKNASQVLADKEQNTLMLSVCLPFFFVWIF